jgi:ribonuclease P/MRP protein subunit POP1
MAHNHYRIPVKLRLQALQDLVGSEKPGVLERSKCRKHRRKLRYMMHLYEIRQRRYRWMETHVWHAKRFKMQNMEWNGGVRVPKRKRMHHGLELL